MLTVWKLHNNRLQWGHVFLIDLCVAKHQRAICLPKTGSYHLPIPDVHSALSRFWEQQRPWYKLHSLLLLESNTFQPLPSGMNLLLVSKGGDCEPLFCGEFKTECLCHMRPDKRRMTSGIKKHSNSCLPFPATWAYAICKASLLLLSMCIVLPTDSTSLGSLSDAPSPLGIRHYKETNDVSGFVVCQCEGKSSLARLESLQNTKIYQSWPMSHSYW